MTVIEASQRITPIAFKNILYLTDFSQASKAALPFAMAVARNHGAMVHAVHVLGSNRHDGTSPELRAALLSCLIYHTRCAVKRRCRLLRLLLR